MTMSKDDKTNILNKLSTEDREKMLNAGMKIVKNIYPELKINNHSFTSNTNAHKQKNVSKLENEHKKI